MFILYPKIRHAFFLTGLVFCIQAANAAPVDSVTAKTVAGNFYAQNYRVNNPSLSLVYTERSENGEPEYYVYNVHSGGFVIVSAEDAAHPIIGYSDEKNYSVSNMSPDFAYWMQTYKKQVEFIRAQTAQASADIQIEWFAYKNNQPLSNNKRTTGSVAPLVQTAWAQSPYFNADCPGGSPAGCVATAMSQIMKYWAYPPHGLFSTSYKDGSYGTLSADFDTTQYIWANMPLYVTGKNAMLAALNYDIGIAVNMSYSPAASGSFMINADNSISAQSAFVQYFGYNGSTIQGFYRYNYSDANWIALLETELNNGRPLQYAGSGNKEGHSWVCDGYNSSNNFHMNWGWAGNYDGYFNLNALNPDAIPLDSNQEALIGIEPNPAIADFDGSPLLIRAGDTVTFHDNSFGPDASHPVTNLEWSFPGGAMVNSNISSPQVVYGSPGTYNVSETATTSKGGNTLTFKNYVTVLENNTVNVYPTLNDGTFTIQLHDGTLIDKNLNFCLYDVYGRKVFTTILVQYITQVTVFLPHGFYIFRAFDSSDKSVPVSTGKLVMK